MVKSTPPREIWRSSHRIPNCACMLASQHASTILKSVDLPLVFVAELHFFCHGVAEYLRYILRRSSLNRKALGFTYLVQSTRV